MITANQFKTLDDIYNYYNEVLFGNELPQCMINLSRKNGTYGFFAPDRWRNEKEDKEIIHEISINPDHMNRPEKEWHATLVHEMCHLKQEEFGHPSRRGYHNLQFSYIMEDVGLITSDTGEEGGKRAGQHMTHYIKKGGKFEKAFYSLLEDENYQNRTFYMPNSLYLAMGKGGSGAEGGDGEEGAEGEDEGENTTKKKSKIKYTCSCGLNVWGKPGLNIKCNGCESDFIEQE